MTDSEWRRRIKKLLVEHDPCKNFEMYEELVSERAPLKSWAGFEKWVRRFKDRGTFRGQANARIQPGLTVLISERNWHKAGGRFNAVEFTS
jgi:hypothetical protein